MDPYITSALASMTATQLGAATLFGVGAMNPSFRFLGQMAAAIPALAAASGIASSYMTPGADPMDQKRAAGMQAGIAGITYGGGFALGKAMDIHLNTDWQALVGKPTLGQYASEAIVGSSTHFAEKAAGLATFFEKRGLKAAGGVATGISGGIGKLGGMLSHMPNWAKGVMIAGAAMEGVELLAHSAMALEHHFGDGSRHNNTVASNRGVRV
jgi:hypothetical protein